MAINLANKFRDGDQGFVTVEDIVRWDWRDVNNYLIKNEIYGCGPVLNSNSVDGGAFLTLNPQKILSWGIPAIKRSKILALLNGLGTEDKRKDIVIKASISSRLQTATSCLQLNRVSPSQEPESLNTYNKKITLPVNHLMLSHQQHAKTLGYNKSKHDFGITIREVPLKATPAGHHQLPGGPPIPPKPDHLRPHLQNQQTQNNDKFPKNVINKKWDTQAAPVSDDRDYVIPIAAPRKFVNGNKVVSKPISSGAPSTHPLAWQNVARNENQMVDLQSDAAIEDESYEIPNGSHQNDVDMQSAEAYGEGESYEVPYLSSQKTSVDMQSEAYIDDESYDVPDMVNMQSESAYMEDESYEVLNENVSSQKNDPRVFKDPSCRLDENYHYDDDFTSDSDDEHTGFFIPPKQFQDKRKDRKKGFFQGFFSPRLNSADEKFADGDPCGTPPVLPSRNPSRCSSEASLSHSAESQTPPPTLPPLPPLPHSRKVSTVSTSSQSSLAESPMSSGSRYLNKKKTPPVYRPSPLPSETNFGRLMPKSGASSRVPSPSPCSSNRSSDSSTDSDATIYPWFLNVDRKQAEDILTNLANGTFLVRPSKHGGSAAPVTLSLQYNQRIFHILIRKRIDGKLALGTEKIGENGFSSLSELVEHHHVEPMFLHSGQQLAGTTYLTQWPEIFH